MRASSFARLFRPLDENHLRTSAVAAMGEEERNRILNAGRGHDGHRGHRPRRWAAASTDIRSACRKPVSATWCGRTPASPSMPTVAAMIVYRLWYASRTWTRPRRSPAARHRQTRHGTDPSPGGEAGSKSVEGARVRRGFVKEIGRGDEHDIASAVPNSPGKTLRSAPLSHLRLHRRQGLLRLPERRFLQLVGALRQERPARRLMAR